MLRTAAPALLAALIATGCAMPMKPGGAVTALTAQLGAADEVPPTRSNGSGTLDARYDPGSRKLTWSITYFGLSGPLTAAHFHGPAAPGTNTGVVVPFKGDLGSPITGEATLSEIQSKDLLAGKWYVNLHTAANPGGEIRGQVLAKP